MNPYLYRSASSCLNSQKVSGSETSFALNLVKNALGHRGQFYRSICFEFPVYLQTQIYISC